MIVIYTRNINRTHCYHMSVVKTLIAMFIIANILL